MINDSLYQFICSTLRVERFEYGRTLLQAFHCPATYLERGVMGINLYLEGNVSLDIKGEEIIDLVPGEAIILPANQPQRMTNHSIEKTISVWHTVQYSILDTIDPIELLDTPYKLTAEYSDQIIAIGNRLNRERGHTGESILSRLGFEHQIAIELFNLILGCSKLKPGAEEMITRHNRIQPALQFMQENLKEDLCINHLAQRLNLSEARFFEVFREAVGSSPGRYLQKLRLREARKLLMTSNLCIYEIGTRTGYKDAFHFSRIFKKRTGVSPQQFRRQFTGYEKADN